MQRPEPRNRKRLPRASEPEGEGSTSQPANIGEREVEDVQERSTPRTPVIYEVVRRQGEEEMVGRRPRCGGRGSQRVFPSVFLCSPRRYSNTIFRRPSGGLS